MFCYENEFYTKERTCRLVQGKKEKGRRKERNKEEKENISRRANKAAEVTNYTIIVHVHESYLIILVQCTCYGQCSSLHIV